MESATCIAAVNDARAEIGHSFAFKDCIQHELGAAVGAANPDHITKFERLSLAIKPY